MPTKLETEKSAERESGTRNDVKAVDGRHESMRYSRHEMGEYSEGTEFHESHRGK